VLLAHAGEQAARLARAEAAAASQEEKAEKRRAKKARQRAARAQATAQQGPDQSNVPHSSSSAVTLLILWLCPANAHCQGQAITCTVLQSTVYVFLLYRAGE